MSVIKCVAIDDEPLALSVIERFADKIPDLSVQAVFQNPLTALEYIQKESIDLLFLDIHMPDLNGMELLQSLPDKPLVVFTTAYTEYALESYEWDAVDYLLKPFIFERFVKSVNKARQHMSKQEEVQTASQLLSPRSYVFIKSDTRFFKINLTDILYIEGMRDYIAVHTHQQRILTLMSMTKMLTRLPESEFKRVHKSYIINVHHIEMVQNNRIQLAGQEIPISNSYKEDFHRFMESRME